MDRVEEGGGLPRESTEPLPQLSMFVGDREGEHEMRDKSPRSSLEGMSMSIRLPRSDSIDVPVASTPSGTNSGKMEPWGGRRANQATPQMSWGTKKQEQLRKVVSSRQINREEDTRRDSLPYHFVTDSSESLPSMSRSSGPNEQEGRGRDNSVLSGPSPYALVLRPRDSSCSSSLSIVEPGGGGGGEYNSPSNSPSCSPVKLSSRAQQGMGLMTGEENDASPSYSPTKLSSSLAQRTSITRRQTDLDSDMGESYADSPLALLR